MTPSTSQKLSTTIKRVIRAPRIRVFDAFSSLEQLQKWFGPGECRVAGGEVTFAEGGAYRLEMITEEFGPVELKGVYRRIVRNEQIELSWQWHGAPQMDWGEMEVSISFADVPEGTEITIRHAGFAAAEIREAHIGGWKESFDHLDAIF